MAESLKPVIGRFLLCAGCLTMAAYQAHAAESLPDPTRPAQANGAAGQSASGAGATPVLQSVLISPRRKVAVISGETVQVGDRIGDGRVVRIAEGEVALARDGQIQILKLFPGLEIRRTKVQSSARETGRRQ